MKENRGLIIINIVLLCVVVVALVTFMFWGLNFEFDTKQELLKREVFSLEDVKEIVSEFRDYDILIEKGNINEIKVELYGSEKNKDKIDLELNNGKLKLEQSGRFVCFGFCYSNNIAKIYVPDDFDKEVTLVSTSGDINVKVNLEDDKVNLKTTSGNIYALYINEGKVYSTSGDIDIKMANKIVASSTSGEVEIGSASVADIKTTSGDIVVRTLKSSGDIKSTSGEITIDNFNINGDTVVEAISGDINISLINDAIVSASTVSGDKHIKEMTGEYNLNLKTVSGDIVVR